MQAEKIQELLHTAPFAPFSIHMANGRKFYIDHPEVAMFSTKKRSLVVALPNDAFAILDLKLATHTETDPKLSRSRRR